ncbi:SDR family oxidoreductase [bacterium]|nr:SDR family oxidoreductase [bacterium]
MKQVLVAGATGYLGRHLVRELHARGYRVRALARNADRLRNLETSIDEVFVGEVTDPGTLRGVCNNADAVISAVGITKQKDGLSYMDVDYQGNRNLLSEAEDAGVGRFVYVSVFTAGEAMQDLAIVKAKTRFTSCLKKSRLAHTIIYPNGFFSDMMEYLHMAEKGRAYVLGDGNARANPIHGADLAAVTVDAMENETEEISVGGPEVFTHREIAALAFEAVEKPPKIVRVPTWIAAALLWLLRLCTPARIYGPLEFFVTVLSQDMIAPVKGIRKLSAFFLESALLQRRS